MKGILSQTKVVYRIKWQQNHHDCFCARSDNSKTKSIIEIVICHATDVKGMSQCNRLKLLRSLSRWLIFYNLIGGAYIVQNLSQQSLWRT